MLDGRVDTHGTVKELRAQGLLDDIAHDAALEAREKEEEAAAAPPSEEEPATDTAAGEPTADAPVKPKKARKLVEEEERQSGSVKWRIYNTYLKAS